MKQKVVVFSQIDPVILAQLKAQFNVVEINPKLGDVNQQIAHAVTDADAMIGAGRLLNQSNLASATRLKVISSVSVGYDNYDVAYLKQRNIVLCHTTRCID